MDDLFSTYSRLLEGVSGGSGSSSRAARTNPLPRTRARCAQRRSTSSAACCPPRRSRTWACTRAARRTSSSCCICSRIRSPRRARTGRCCSRSCRRSSRASSTRVPREDRGGRWIEFLRERRVAADTLAARLGLDEDTAPAHRRYASCGRTAPRRSSLAALLYESTATGEEEALRAVSALSQDNAPRFSAS